MARETRIDNNLLLKAGLELMRINGKPLTRRPSRGRAMIFSLENGQTVRARTCNDHVLITVADRPTGNAKLNIEGTDWLLIVMPEKERAHGNVIAYLVPTDVAVTAVRSTHQKWLATNPATKGDNKAWNLWFDETEAGKASDFARKWAKYRLNGRVSTDAFSDTKTASERGSSGDLKAEVRGAKERIAAVAGVRPEFVKISIEFGGA